jgi:hypothetical protein
MWDQNSLLEFVDQLPEEDCGCRDTECPCGGNGPTELIDAVKGVVERLKGLSMHIENARRGGVTANSLWVYHQIVESICILNQRTFMEEQKWN